MLQARPAAARTFESYCVTVPGAATLPEQPASTSWRQHQQQHKHSQVAVQRELATLRRRFSTVITSRITRFSTPGLVAWTKRGGGYVPAALIWTGALHRDLQAMMQEMDVPASVASAIITAARAGNVSCNPGVILLQVMQLQPLQQLLGRLAFAQVLQTMPSVLNHDPGGLILNFQSLAPAFGTRQFTGMLCKYPKLLLSSPFTVWGNLLAISQLADISLEEAATLVARQPRLLTNSPPALRLRFRTLAQLTGLHTKAAQRLVRQQPALLSYFPDTLEGNLESMTATLDLPVSSCCKLIQRQPTLLMLGAGSLRDRLQALELILSVTPQHVHTMVLRQPSILTLSSQLLSTKLDRLCDLLSIAPQDARALVLDQPVLLTLSSDGLAAKLQSLRAVAALRPEWQLQLGAVRPKTLASWLCFSKARHQRFQALATALDHPVAKLLDAAVAGTQVSVGEPPECLKLPSLPSILRMQDSRFQQVFEDLSL